MFDGSSSVASPNLMNLEVLGRRVTLTRDDATSACFASEQHLLTIGDTSVDRYDVRLLLEPATLDELSSRMPLSDTSGDISEELLDAERYKDLKEVEVSEENPKAPSGTEHIEQDQSFRPSFFIPEDMQRHVPLLKKQHQLILKTAQFVTAEGGQAEVVLKVQQGPDSKFAFLFDNHLNYRYYKWLCENPSIVCREERSLDKKVSSEERFSHLKSEDGTSNDVQQGFDDDDERRKNEEGQTRKSPYRSAEDLHSIGSEKERTSTKCPSSQRSLETRNVVTSMQKEENPHHRLTYAKPHHRQQIRRKRRFHDAPDVSPEAMEKTGDRSMDIASSISSTTQQDLKKARIRQILRRKQQERMRHIHTDKRGTEAVADHKRAFENDDDVVDL